MLNKFEIESMNITSSHSRVHEAKCGTTAHHCSVRFTETYFEKDGFYAIWNHQNPEKNDNFGKSSKFPGIPAGNFRDRRFKRSPKNEKSLLSRESCTTIVK